MLLISLNISIHTEINSQLKNNIHKNGSSIFFWKNSRFLSTSIQVIIFFRLFVAQFTEHCAYTDQVIMRHFNRKKSAR